MAISETLKDKILALKGPIFVYGASGFIGINLFNEIFAQRQDCYALTHDASKAWRIKLNDIPSENVIHCDIVSPTSVKSVFDKYRPQTIFNLAAYGAYAKQQNKTLTYETNLIGTLNILDLCTEGQVYVHAGSSSEYGYNCDFPSETDTLEPNSHYAVSKVSAAYMIAYYAKMHNTNAVNLRLYAIYGHWEEPDRLIPKVVENARKAQLPHLVNPDISRDFVFIKDCIEAFLDVSLKMNGHIRGKSYNIASGQKTTIADLVNLVQEQFGVKDQPSWNSMPNRNWDLANWYGNPAAAQKDFGWQSKTSLKEGLKRTKLWQDSIGYEDTIIPAFENPYLNPKITAIIACYKDAEAMPYMYERLVKTFNEIRVRYEIIFVNDCSPDHTDKVLTDLCNQDPNVVGITHSRNFGSQAAFQSGMEISTGDAVVLMDGDLQDPPEIIPQFYAQWQNGYEVVYGVREQREMPDHIHFFYKSFYRVFKKLSYINIPNDAGDFSMIDQKVVKQLVALPETEQFLRGLRAWVGFKQTGVNYIRPERMFGVSTNNWSKNIWWAKKAIFSFSFAPLEMMSYAGFLLTGLSFLGIVWQVLSKIFNFDPNTPYGLSTVIILVIFFGGLTILGISFLGEYIAKIFEETKKRPKYIRTQIQKGTKLYRTDAEINTLVEGSSSFFEKK
jgi:polyisoprenyl-phosphate glycosyltransferase